MQEIDTGYQPGQVGECWSPGGGCRQGPAAHYAVNTAEVAQETSALVTAAAKFDKPLGHNRGEHQRERQ